MSTIQHIPEIDKLFQLYITNCRYGKQLSPKTIKSYREVFRTFRKMLPELNSTEDLHPAIVPEFFRILSNRKRIVGKDKVQIGVRPATIKTYYDKLIAFFRWLENNDHVPAGFSNRISKPKEPAYDDTRALTDNEVSRILSSITMHSRGTHFQYLRDLIIIELLLYTGLRKGELLGLRIADIDFVKNNIFINGHTSKSKRSRYIPLHYALASHLKAYLSEREKLKLSSERLIISVKDGIPLTEHGLKYWVKKYSRLSGVKFHIHRFRHTFACKLALENANIISIMNVLGHSSTRMTERYLRSIKTESSRNYIENIVY